MRSGIGRYEEALLQEMAGALGFVGGEPLEVASAIARHIGAPEPPGNGGLGAYIQELYELYWDWYGGQGDT